MTILEEAVNTPIATAELERRWALIRKAMDASRIDVLIMHNNNDYLGGYVKYFTDVPAMNGYPVTVIFPHQDLMTLIQHGPTGVVEQLPPNGDGLIRGVKTVMYCASFRTSGILTGLRCCGHNEGAGALCRRGDRYGRSGNTARFDH